MKYEMNLHNDPFILIKQGSKTIELRLDDERRSMLKVHDTIEFTNRSTEEKLLVEIEDLKRYSDFIELYKHYDKISMGYKTDEEASPEDMNKYYSKELQSKYGVLAIKIKVIK